jgi:hypothetical protein
MKIRDVYILHIVRINSNMPLWVGHVADRRKEIGPEVW